MARTLWLKGKTKDLFTTPQPDELLMHFRDDVAAYRLRKWGVLAGKGAWNAAITHRLFKLIEGAGIPTQLLDQPAPDELRVRKLDILPLKLITRNLAAGTLAKRLKLAEGEPLPRPIMEFLYMSDELGDPLVNHTHIQAFGWATPAQIKAMEKAAATINETLVPFLEERGLVLVDFRLEFGVQNRQLYLANELTPDTCRLWDSFSAESLDKDRFRQDLDLVREAYQEVFNRICQA